MREKLDRNDIGAIVKSGFNKAKQKNYWENYLSGAEQNDDLFNKANFERRSYGYVLGEEISIQIAEFARENGISVASLLYCAWGVLAQKLNNTHDIMFGTTTSDRTHPMDPFIKIGRAHV